MQAFKKKLQIFNEFLFEKKNSVEGCGLRKVPGEFVPRIFLVPHILMKRLFLNSLRTKFSESGVLS
jgi:hypothetical protein